jgi:2-amino-4-hydroxy-6-hydroxymethyldihydropteridine diphosphokinase
MNPLRNTCWLSLGSNLGKREQNLLAAIRFLESEGMKLKAASAVYLSGAWGFDSRNDFLNMVVIMDTEADLHTIHHLTEKAETAGGRTRGATDTYQDRTIDVDILFFNNQVTDTPHLTIPHPRIGERRFILGPLAEVSPELIHPVTGKTIKKMLDECMDHGKVLLFKDIKKLMGTEFSADNAGDL